jgi:hypothetical protein
VGNIMHGFIDLSCSTRLKEVEEFSFLRKEGVTYVTG